MKTREVTLASGERFTVPQGVQRLDSKTTRGWQVRYHGTRYFPDGDSGPHKSLQVATRELLRRIASMPAPVGIRREPSPSKGSDLPPGISGPIVESRRGGKIRAAVLSVLIPRFAATNLIKKVHIGTPNTYTQARFEAALEKAMKLRTSSIAKYEADATKARRRAAASMKKEQKAISTAAGADSPRTLGLRNASPHDRAQRTWRCSGAL